VGNFDERQWGISASAVKAVTGSVIILGFYIAVLAAMALGWWRQR
jgi:hypothetical protein